MDREKALETAKSLICGDRDRDYGNPTGSFELISKLWSDYLGTDIKARDVGIMMALLKIARLRTSGKADSAIDVCGYGACVAELDSETDVENTPDYKNKR